MQDIALALSVCILFVTAVGLWWTSPQGPEGNQGPKGPEGPVGVPATLPELPENITGLQGLRGPRGAPGLPFIGLRGNSGPTGPSASWMVNVPVTVGSQEGTADSVPVGDAYELRINLTKPDEFGIGNVTVTPGTAWDVDISGPFTATNFAFKVPPLPAGIVVPRNGDIPNGFVPCDGRSGGLLMKNVPIIPNYIIKIK